jgi:AbiV family abortive infection protein
MEKELDNKFALSIKEIAKGIQLCIDNATSLIKEANLLYENGYYSRALSLCILALEEIGKAIYLDSLAFRYADDKKWLDNFKRNINLHESKLAVIDFFPVWLHWWLRLINDPVVNLSVAIVLERYKRRRLTAEQLLPEFKERGIKYLNEIKKEGFYVDLKKEFTSPLSLSKDKVEILLRMASDIVDLTQFVLKRTLNSYVEFVLKSRIKVSDSLKNIQQELEKVFEDEERFKQTFGDIEDLLRFLTKNSRNRVSS